MFSLQRKKLLAGGKAYLEYCLFGKAGNESATKDWKHSDRIEVIKNLMVESNHLNCNFNWSSQIEIRIPDNLKIGPQEIHRVHTKYLLTLD